MDICSRKLMAGWLEVSGAMAGDGSLAPVGGGCKTLLLWLLWFADGAMYLDILGHSFTDCANTTSFCQMGLLSQ